MDFEDFEEERLLAIQTQYTKEEQLLLIFAGADADGCEQLGSMRQAVRAGCHPDNGYTPGVLYPALRRIGNIHQVVEIAESYLSLRYGFGKEGGDAH